MRTTSETPHFKHLLNWWTLHLFCMWHTVLNIYCTSAWAGRSGNEDKEKTLSQPSLRCLRQGGVEQGLRESTRWVQLLHRQWLHRRKNPIRSIRILVPKQTQPIRKRYLFHDTDWLNPWVREGTFSFLLQATMSSNSSCAPQWNQHWITACLYVLTYHATNHTQVAKIMVTTWTETAT